MDSGQLQTGMLLVTAAVLLLIVFVAVVAYAIVNEQVGSPF